MMAENGIFFIFFSSQELKLSLAFAKCKYQGYYFLITPPPFPFREAKNCFWIFSLLKPFFFYRKFWPAPQSPPPPYFLAKISEGGGVWEVIPLICYFTKKIKNFEHFRATLIPLPFLYSKTNYRGGATKSDKNACFAATYVKSQLKVVSLFGIFCKVPYFRSCLQNVTTFFQFGSCWVWKVCCTKVFTLSVSHPFYLLFSKYWVFFA